MSYTIILETDCVVCADMQDVIDLCPVEAIRKDPQYAYPYINDDCINCSACVGACPYNAIAEDLDKPPKNEVN